MFFFFLPQKLISHIKLTRDLSTSTPSFRLIQCIDFFLLRIHKNYATNQWKTCSHKNIYYISIVGMESCNRMYKCVNIFIVTIYCKYSYVNRVISLIIYNYSRRMCVYLYIKGSDVRYWVIFLLAYCCLARPINVVRWCVFYHTHIIYRLIWCF